MNIAPTTTAKPKVRINHWRVLTGSFLVRRLRMDDELAFLPFASACRIQVEITVKSLWSHTSGRPGSGDSHLLRVDHTSELR